MLTGPAHANVLAKTGTLDDASALSGYVTTAQRPPRAVLDADEPRAP